jgi:hypothetical protein
VDFSLLGWDPNVFVLLGGKVDPIFEVERGLFLWRDGLKNLFFNTSISVLMKYTYDR